MKMASNLMLGKPEQVNRMTAGPSSGWNGGLKQTNCMVAASNAAVANSSSTKSTPRGIMCITFTQTQHCRVNKKS